MARHRASGGQRNRPLTEVAGGGSAAAPTGRHPVARVEAAPAGRHAVARVDAAPSAPQAPEEPLDGGPVDGGPVDGGPVDGGPVDGERLVSGPVGYTRPPASRTCRAPVPGTGPQMSRRAARELRRRVPSEVRETLGWAGFAAVVALGVIAASDHGLAAAAMWALGLLAIAAVAVVTLKLTGMRLDHLHRRRHG